MAKMTTQAKLAQAIAMVAKYTDELAAETIRDNIEAGDLVTFTQGRADTKQELTGTVAGIRTDKNGTWVAVTAGEGFDLQRYTIRLAAITSNPAADARNATEVAPPAAEEVDPLEAE